LKKTNGKSGPYLAVCGKCNIALKVHPVKHCPYDYKPVVYNGRLYGYKMVQKET
jgi:hypothetical protein